MAVAPEPMTTTFLSAWSRLSGQNYRKDRKMFRDDPIQDAELIFERAGVVEEAAVLQEAS